MRRGLKQSARDEVQTFTKWKGGASAPMRRGLKRHCWPLVGEARSGGASAPMRRGLKRANPAPNIASVPGRRLRPDEKGIETILAASSESDWLREAPPPR